MTEVGREPETQRQTGTGRRDAMNVTLIKALFALVPVCMLLAGSVVAFSRGRTVWSVLQLFGAGCLVVVVFTHLCEALDWFPWMRWGEEHSVGHYLDLSSAVLGSTLLPVGYFLHRRERLSSPPNTASPNKKGNERPGQGIAEHH